jgi:peptide chain release factor subunit 3
MSDLNSWEDDPAAQEENLSRQTQQVNLNNNPQQGGTFRPAASSFQPGAQTFQPGHNFQQYGGGYDQAGYQNYYNAQAGQGYGYPQYGQQGGYNQFPQGGYNAGYNQGGYNQTYGEHIAQVTDQKHHHFVVFPIIHVNFADEMLM